MARQNGGLKGQGAHRRLLLLHVFVNGPICRHNMMSRMSVITICSKHIFNHCVSQSVSQWMFYFVWSQQLHF